MKKLSLSIIALAAISTSTLASERGYDLHKANTCMVKHALSVNPATADSKKLVLAKNSCVLTHFQRLMLNSGQIGNDNHSNQNDSRDPPDEM